MSTDAESSMGEQVQELLERSESKALEFKTDLHDQGQAAALIAAMANSGGGQIVLGANERAEAVGLEDSERTRGLLERGAAEIVPAVSVNFREESVGEQPLLIAELEPNRDQGPFAPPSGAIQRRDEQGRNVVLSGQELIREARTAGGGQGDLEGLLGNMNRKLEAMQERDEKTTEEARQAFKEAKDARSWKAQMQGWLIGGAIGALLGAAATALLGP